MVRLGHARVSTRTQEIQSQVDALEASQVHRLFHEQISTRVRERPEMKAALAAAREYRSLGAKVTLVVHEMKRLGRGAGVSVIGALLDRFPHAALTTAVATQAVGMLGLYAAGTHPVAAVVFLVLIGGALGPVFMTTQNEMLHCAPGRTDIALAANSGAYNAGIAAGAALGGLVLPLADLQGTFLAGGLVTVGSCAVLLGGRLLRYRPESAE